ncbi:caspase b-like isoform X2 [Watersipora subatra]|uniref:caspase b-like isoform X2 n=1 Tax=Watersipora subatra TaxID=2589382 RepID=UPI00355B602E
MWKTKKRIQLWLNVELSGLPLPNYGFQLMTVAVLNELSSNINTQKVFANGAIVYHDGLELHLVHDAHGQKTTIQVASDEPHFGGIWKQLEKATGSILKLLSTVWPASWSDIRVFCGHCLFLREPDPEEIFNPDWFCQEGDTLTVERCSGVLKLICEKHDQENVLSALVRPCHQLDEEKRRIIQEYLNTLLVRSAATEKVVAPVRQQHIEELATPVQPQQNEDSIDMHPVTPVSQPATEGLAISVQLQQSENSQSDSELSDTLDQASEGWTVKLCSKSSVKDLYHSDYVYRMSTMRGRCLLINNITFTYPNGTSDNREGSALDGQRILFLFRQLGFLCFSEENLSSQRMLEVIRNETGRHADENYGMFVLVIMSHGSETGISGTDGTMVQRTDINNALSAQNFPAMARKPKLLIVQACSGGLQDRVVLDSQPATSSPHPGSSLPSVFGLPTNEVPSSSTMTLPLSTPITSSVWMHPAGSHAVLETDDLLIWEASFRGHMAYRHLRYGSWFINAVVESLSKHACHRDLKTLFDKQIRKKVRKRSIQYGEGQQPDMSCTLQKKLFLFPGYNPPDPE